MTTLTVETLSTLDSNDYYSPSISDNRRLSVNSAKSMFGKSQKGDLQPSIVLSLKRWRYDADRRPKKLENTYQMTPKSKFRPMFVEKEVEKILEDFLESNQYDPSNAGKMTSRLADVIKSRLKQCGFDRHKVVVQVFLGSKQNQRMEVATRCVWDADTDNFSSARWETTDAYAVANVFGVYYE